jgi:hypothetical protein
MKPKKTRRSNGKIRWNRVSAFFALIFCTGVAAWSDSASIAYMGLRVQPEHEALGRDMNYFIEGRLSDRVNIPVLTLDSVTKKLSKSGHNGTLDTTAYSTLMELLGAAMLFDAQVALLGDFWICNLRLVRQDDSLVVHRATMQAFDSPLLLRKPMLFAMDSLLRCVNALKKTPDHAGSSPRGMRRIKGGTYTHVQNGKRMVRRIKDFYLDTAEVTIDDFVDCMVAGACTGLVADPEFPRDQSPWHYDYPIQKISWVEALAYCAWAGKRLPEPYEWEYACLANGMPDHEKTLDQEWLRENSGEMVHPVATRKPNKFGLYDMIGNVWEWTADSKSVQLSKNAKRGMTGSAEYYNWGFSNFSPRGGTFLSNSERCKCQGGPDFFDYAVRNACGVRCARSTGDAK